MVLCKFFQQGNCRFGTKCNNEHFDVKQILKTDIEAAVNGKQWPISSYGPFKDKPCIPNFIDDQSYEEMRFLCYESRKGNFFDQFHQQFGREVLEATNKMKTLLQFTPAVIDLVTKVYDLPSEEPAAKSSNPFSFGGAAGAPNAQSGGIFGNAATNNTNMAGNTQANNIFGGSNASTNIFQTPASAQQQQQGSIFGQQTAPATNSIFGGGATNPQTGSIFQQAQQQPAAVGGGGLFAQAAQQSASHFGMFGQQQQQQPPIGGGNIFAQAAAQTQPTQQTGFFGGVAQTPTPATAAEGSMFAQPAGQQAGAQQQQQPAAQQTNIFAQAAQQFNQGQTQPPAGGFFQQAMQQQPQQQPLLPNPMQQQQQQQQPQHQALPSIYSRLEDLTADEIAAFKADAFMPGKLPSVPPPRELVN